MNCHMKTTKLEKLLAQSYMSEADKIFVNRYKSLKDCENRHIQGVENLVRANLLV